MAFNYNLSDAEELIYARDFIEKTKEIFKKQGVSGFTKHVTHDLNRWKNVKIKIAVTGNSGAGKSSLINALRGIEQSDGNAAEEGVKETTRRTTSYSFPDNDQIELYDIPGVGTLKHPIESYMRDMNFKQYDFVIIVSSDRFSENDALIIKELKRLQKPFYLVRSKIHSDVNNQKFEQTRDKVLQIIRDDCVLNLQNVGVEAKYVFLIDSHVHQDYELEKLQMTLVHDAPDIFKEILFLTFRTMTKEIIGEKPSTSTIYYKMAYSYPDTEEFLDAGEFIKETCDIFKTQGVKGLIKHVTHNLNYKWKHAKIKVAVTGDSGAGISSLINALRGMHQGDQNAAKEGVKGTTKERGLYTFPDNDQIELYDLPGVGTLSHPIESYMRDMNFEQYDFILIVSSERFSQNDALIIKELQILKKPFYLVRSKIFADVANQKFTQTKDEVIKIIRDDCYLNLQKLGVEAKCVFLLDSHAHQDFELGKLQATLIRDVRDTFKTTLILTYRTMMKQIIEEKVKVLKNRVYEVVTAVPMANEFFIQEISFYKKKLGLDDEALSETCKYLEVDMARLQEMIAFCDFVVFPEKTIEYINNFKEKLDNAPPSLTNFLFGTPAPGFVGTKVCRGLLNVIDTLEKDSLKISENVLEKVRGSSFV